MITVMLENTSTDDLFVMVIDANREGHPAVYEDRLNEGEIAPVDVQEDDRGYADLTWHAKRVDAPGIDKIHEAEPGPGDTVEISL